MVVPMLIEGSRIGSTRESGGETRGGAVLVPHFDVVGPEGNAPQVPPDVHLHRALERTEFGLGDLLCPAKEENPRRRSEPRARTLPP